MGCDLCGAMVGAGMGRCLNCDFWDLGDGAVICVVRALGAGMGRLVGLGVTIRGGERKCARGKSSGALGQSGSRLV